MTRWKRVGLSFASAMIADVVVAASAVLLSHEQISLNSLIFAPIAFLYLVIPGWLVSLPFILLIEGNTRRTFIILAVIGILIGPLMISSIALYSERTRSLSNTTTWTQGLMTFAYFATAISIAATAIYLAVLKLSARSTQTP